MNQKLDELLKITELVFNSEKSKLKSVASEEIRILKEIESLTCAIHKRAQTLKDSDGDNCALYSGADYLWSRWCQQEKIRLNILRAEILARLECQKHETKTAFGKNEAAKRIGAVDNGSVRNFVSFL